MDTSSRASQEFHIRKPKGTKVLILLFLAFIIIYPASMFFPIIMTNPDGSLVYIFFMLVLLWVATYLYKLSFERRLIISEAGIRYEGVKYRVFSKWDDLSLIRNRSLTSPFGRLRLISRSPQVKRNLWFDWDLDVLLGSKRFVIPLGSNLWEDQSQLWGVLQEHRPDLFYEEESRRDPSSRDEK